MFKKVATLQFKKIYASDSNGNYYWRDFVKQANSQPMTDANFIPKNFYEYDTKNFLYITARAISGMEKWGPNGNFDAFPWEELKKSYPTFCGKGYYIEHKEDDEMDAKGIILDAQSDDDNEFINCICAISKQEYPEICEDILNGKLNQVSMSCLAAECECSFCHNVATKEEELCEHMNPEHPHFCKGQTDINGKPIYEINRNIVFTGLSGVAVPADKDAFIFDVKASKKQNSKTINKEYNKYCRAKKEYEYINSLLEKEDTRKYIESQLKKVASDIKGKDYKELLDNIKKSGYEFDEHYYDEEYNDIKVFKDGKEYIMEVWIEDYEAPDSYRIINIKDTGKTYKDLGDFLLNSNLKKKADIDPNVSAEDILKLNFDMPIEKADKVKEQLNEKDIKYESRKGKYTVEFSVDIEADKVDLVYEIIRNIKKSSSTKKQATIKHENGVYNVYSEKGKCLGKDYKTKEEAEKRLKQVEYFKNKKADVEYMSDTIKEIPPIDFETEFMKAGKSKGCNSDINKDQLELGIKVEMEHTTNPVIAEKIACDHIKEIPNYYTLLAEMEASAKASYDAAKQEINKETNEEFPTKLASKQFFKVNKSSKQFFKVNKANKNWFKIANIDNYGLSELQRKELQNVINHIDIVNEDIVVTWDELVESVNQDILDYDFMNKNKVNIMDYIENELGQKIEAY